MSKHKIIKIYRKNKPDLPPVDVLIDDEDYEKFSKYTWSYSSIGAVRLAKNNEINTLYPKYTTSYLHREILNAKSNTYVRRRNDNKFDCRRANLYLEKRNTPVYVTKSISEYKFFIQPFILIKNNKKVLLDTEDFYRYRYGKWYYDGSSNVILGNHRGTIDRQLTKLIMNIRHNSYKIQNVLHINGNIYDCRKSNLKILNTELDFMNNMSIPNIDVDNTLIKQINTIKCNNIVDGMNYKFAPVLAFERFNIVSERIAELETTNDENNKLNLMAYKIELRLIEKFMKSKLYKTFLKRKADGKIPKFYGPLPEEPVNLMDELFSREDMY